MAEKCDKTITNNRIQERKETQRYCDELSRGEGRGQHHNFFQPQQKSFGDSQNKQGLKATQVTQTFNPERRQQLP